MRLRGKTRQPAPVAVHGEARVEWYTGFVRDDRFVPVTRWVGGEKDAQRAAARAAASGHPASVVAARVVYPWSVQAQ